MKPKADYYLGGGWGSRISLSDPEGFSKLNLETDLVRVNGHKRVVPQVGQTLAGEFQRSWIVFEFVEVEQMTDPPDQFFAKVKAVQQVMKDTNDE